MSNPIERRIAEITRTGNVLADQLGAVFVVNRRRVRDFRARAAQGIETRSATDAKRRGPKGESPVAKPCAHTSSGGGK